MKVLILSVPMMSQSDNSLFHIVIRIIFLCTSFGFSIGLMVNCHYRNVSLNKVHYNYLQKIVDLKNQMDAYHHGIYPKNYKPKIKRKF